MFYQLLLFLIFRHICKAEGHVTEERYCMGFRVFFLNLNHFNILLKTNIIKTLSSSSQSQSQLYCQFCHMYRTYIQRIEIALLSYSLVHTDNTKH